MNDQNKIYEILSNCDDMCYAGKWQEIIDLGTSLVNDPNSTPTMLLTWIVNGKFTAYHGNLINEYSTILYNIESRLNKELGEDRTDRLINGWIDEFKRFLERKNA